jgi:hypothetical protein
MSQHAVAGWHLAGIWNEVRGDFSVEFVRRLYTVYTLYWKIVPAAAHRTASGGSAFNTPRSENNTSPAQAGNSSDPRWSAGCTAVLSECSLLQESNPPG